MRKLSESNTSAQDKLLYFWQLPVVCNSGFASKFMSALLNVKQQSFGHFLLIRGSKLTMACLAINFINSVKVLL